MRTRLQPWRTALLAILATPLLHCGGMASSGSDDENDEEERSSAGAGGTAGKSNDAGQGGGTSGSAGSGGYSGSAPSAGYSTGGTVGRPFLIAGSARLSCEQQRDDWGNSRAAPDVSNLSHDERDVLAKFWLAAALMEHASIAAFARFTLELLAVGAPAELIRAANTAASDETRHAQLCFALASAYSGRELGPGPLSIDGALDGISLEKLVVTAIAEGCIGETVAAIEAAEQHAHATDETVRGVLAGISEDEARHAELAWRFVKWALEREPSLRAVVAREFERHLSAPRAVAEGSELDLARHGVLSPQARSSLRARVLDQVVREGARALVAEARGSLGGVHHGSSLEEIAR